MKYAPDPRALCLACGTRDDVELTTMGSSSGELDVRVHLCRKHVVIFAYHVALVMGELFQDRLRMPGGREP